MTINGTLVWIDTSIDWISKQFTFHFIWFVMSTQMASWNVNN